LLGSGDHKTSHTCIGNGIVLSVIAGIILTVIGFAFTDELLILFGVTEASYGYAWDYMRIILIGIPFYVFSSGMNAPIRADGSPGYAMFTMVLGAVLNLILDPVAIFILGMSVKGAAIATIIGQIAPCRKPAIFFYRL
jgi:Na+-driven multidrug efflux pump